MQQERRKAERLPADGVCVALTVPGLHGSDQYFGVVADVSRVGIGLTTPMPPPLHARVVVRVNVQEALHEVSMVVKRRSEAGALWRVGLAFDSDDAAAAAFVRDFLRHAAVEKRS